MTHNLPLVAIVGPTASGKSALAIRIAKQFDGEIVCADSRTVYKGMDIGTAKPSTEDRRAVRHHLLDIVEPGQLFSAAQFKQLADAAIADIRRRGKLPLLVGGTGLYVDAVIFNYKFGPMADAALRSRLDGKTVEELQAICRESNIEMPINMQNKRHLIRAIELDGLPKRATKLTDSTYVVGISTEREELKKRITERAHAMVKDGIEQETRHLAQTYGWESEAMSGNIYRSFKGFVEGTSSLDQALEDFVKSDMSLAKRQLTWLKRNPHITWGEPAVLEQEIQSYIRSASHFGTISQTDSKEVTND